MTVEGIDVNETVKKARAALKEEDQLSASTKDLFESLITVVVCLTNRLGLNSRNSSNPPSTDPDKKGKGDGKKKSKKNKGGQNGHEGRTLDPVDDPDKIVDLQIDKRTLPKDRTFTPDGYMIRQEFNIIISRVVTEYRAEILVDQHDNQFVQISLKASHTELSMVPASKAV